MANMHKAKVFVGMSPKEHQNVPTGQAVGSGKKVFVGMSGGVDSSVSAALLKDEGYDVTGVFIKVWQADFLPCSWREERRDAMRAAAHLSIPFITLDLEEAYKSEVVDYMIREYKEGRVPNPDVMCNKYVKFGAFFEYAKAHGADFIATGHYARTLPGEDGSRLFMGVDKEKDQSYFLWTIGSGVLAHTLFPVGDLEKKEVRALAATYGLPNADKKDSQGLCFMGKIEMSEFLKHYLKTEKGDVLAEGGKVIGTHEGAMLYTIGQRKGFETIKSSEHEEPYFVVAKNISQNTITVAHREPTSASDNGLTLEVSDLHLIRPKRKEGEAAALSVRIRYRGELIAAKLERELTEGGKSRVHLAHSAEGIAPGQSAVFYIGEELIAGGVIELAQ